jgi:hypothetical protein
MRVVHAALLLAVSASSALAQRAPVIVVPGKPGVPVVMDGVDVSWAVIEGEFGLDRPGAEKTVIYRPFAVALPYYAPGSYTPGYFPRTGRRPGYGRFEIVPPPDRPLPPAAPTYYRSWSSQSEPSPVTEYPSYSTPPVGMAIRGGRSRQEWHAGASRGSSHGK